MVCLTGRFSAVNLLVVYVLSGVQDMHVSKMVYITRWKEAGSYQHGDCLPHTGGQTGQDVTGILLVGSSSRDVCLYFPSQQFF